MDLIQIPTPEHISAFVESRIGGRTENQDSYGWKNTPFGFLITVCDGMGGGPGGKTASTIAVNEIIKGVEDANAEDTPSNILIKAIRRANMAIIEYSNENPAYSGMGSTCTVILINKKCATIAHVGDSRIYQIRGKSKIYRTFDHSMVFDLVKQKVITEEQARLSAQSNVITRALGAKYDVEVDCAELPYLAKDRFILCTDGIHGAIPESELIEMVSNRSQSLGGITDCIATTIDGEGINAGGGHDNLTIAIIETHNNSTLKVKMNPRLKFLFYTIIIICAISVITNIVQAISKDSEIESESMTAVTEVKNEIDELQQKYDKLKTTSDSTQKALEQSIKLSEKEIAKLKTSNDSLKKANNKLLSRIEELSKTSNNNNSKKK